MKTLIVFLALFASLTANAQQKTWGGTTAVLYPNMATGFKIYSNGSFSISNQTNKLSMSGGALLLDGSAIPAAAGTLTGSTLASGVTASSLTSVGTLGALTVTAPISGSVTGSAGSVSTNANLTGPITSVGNATAIASQTGTGSKFVVDNSPTLITPTLGVASATSAAVTGTNGAGFASFASQSSTPSAPASGFAEFADSTGRKSWRRASDGFVRTWDATLTADRVYTLPDASITIGNAQTSSPLSQFAATTSAQLRGVLSDESGSGLAVFNDTPTLIAPTLGVASSTSESITGTGGAGYIGMVAQSSAPSAPASGFRQYADSTGRFSWIRPSDGFTRTFDATLTANRVYTLPDASITFARSDAAQTFSGTQTFSGDISVGSSVIAFADSCRLASGVLLASSVPVSWSSTSSAAGSLDTRLTRKSAANIRQGSADAAAPVAQFHSVQSVVAGTSNTAGANRTFEGSIGTGTGTGGSIIFQTAPAGSTGTAQNTLVTALTISGEGNLVQPVAKTYSVATGTNQRAGNAVLVGGTVTVTNSTVTANTLVMHARKTIGGTVGNMSYTTSAGNSFTLTSSSGTDTSTISYFLIENP